MKHYIKALWSLLEDNFGGFGVYYTSEASEGYKDFFASVKETLHEAGFNIKDSNVRRLIKIMNREV